MNLISVKSKRGERKRKHMLKKMNRLISLGLMLCAVIILTDRFIVTLPQWLAITMYTGAVIMVLYGMILSRREQS